MLQDFNHHLALHGTAINPDTGLVAEYEELSRCSEGVQWIQSNTEEWGRLTQGLGADSEMPTGANTIYFIHPNDMPKGRTATYVRAVCTDRPEKTNPMRFCLTLGGDCIDYPGSTSTKTADMTAVKALVNSVISTKDAGFITVTSRSFTWAHHLIEMNTFAPLSSSSLNTSLICTTWKNWR